MLVNGEIFRAYDIRGSSLTDLKDKIAYKIGYCFVKMILEPKQNKKFYVCVGRDGRLSSPVLYDALIRGLIDAGANIIALGIIPTPMLYFADKEFKPVASIMVTGSHNPRDDNGFKMLKNGTSFFGAEIQNLLQAINITDWENVPFKNYSSSIKEEVVNIKYLNCILDNIYINSNLKIVFDPGNGATSDILNELIKKLPNKIIAINNVIDGNFPSHHPDPTNPNNLQELIKIVKQQNFDIGIAFDGDGDRIGVVSSTGQILFGDQITCLFAQDILKDNKGATIILDIKASQLIVDKIKEYDGKPIICRSGHPFIKSKMQETKALLAGEMSGHIFFADKYFGFDDAIYAALRFLNLLSKADISLDELIKELPKAYSTPEIKIFVKNELKLQVITEIKELLLKKHIEFNDIDGIRIVNQDGWWLLRASNTESALIVRAESSTSQGLEDLKNIIRELLNKYGLIINA